MFKKSIVIIFLTLILPACGGEPAVDSEPTVAPEPTLVETADPSTLFEIKCTFPGRDETNEQLLDWLASGKVMYPARDWELQANSEARRLWESGFEGPIEVVVSKTATDGGGNVQWQSCP